VARLSDGSVVAWGDDSAGQCVVPALRGGFRYTEVAAGDRHAVALCSDGSVVAWGDDAWGQCDVPALPPGVTYTHVAAGHRNSAARRSDGSVVVWGYNGHGQCDVPAPPPGVTYLDVAVGYRSAMARRTDGAVVGWGDDSYGQCAVPALPEGLYYVELSAAGFHSPPPWTWNGSNTLARRSDGALVVWGDTRTGQAHVPALAAGESWLQLSAGGLFTAAVVGSAPLCAQPVSYCIAGTNSTGHGANLGWAGSTSLAQNDTMLVVTGCPPRRIGLYFFGAYHNEIPFGEGYLCITGNMHRVLPATMTDSAGTGRYVLDFGDTGSPVAIIEPGSTWSFQFWYRDPQPVGHGFNLTDALSASFCP
jgi:hypothetical protein